MSTWLLIALVQSQMEPIKNSIPKIEIYKPKERKKRAYKKEALIKKGT